MSGSIPALIRVEMPDLPLGLLRPGVAVQTRVQGDAGQLFVNLQGIRVPLAAETALQVGQQVRVTLVEAGSTPVVQVVPSEAPGAASSIAPTLGNLLAPVLARLGALEALEVAPRMVPRHLPTTSASLQRLFSVFFAQDTVANDLRTLVALLSDARVLGLVPETTIPFLMGQIGTLAASSPEGFRQLLKSSGHALEARIARAIAEGRLDRVPEVLLGHLRGEILALRGNAGLMAHLRGTRELRVFDETTQSMLDRLGGAEMQQLRALERPYHFLELHLAPESGFTRGQVHFFPDAPARDGDEPERGQTVVLDLEMTRLGAIWVTLRHAAGHCTCSFQTAAPAVREALESEREALSSALLALGFRSVSVTASEWSGDRNGAVAALMDRFGGVEFNG